MDRLTTKTAQDMLGVHDNSHVGDIAHIPQPTSQDDDTVKRLVRAGYIAKAGTRYVLTRKVLWR